MSLSLSSIYSRCSKRGDCRLWGGALSANGHPYVYCPDTYAEKGPNGMRPARHVVWSLVHKTPVPAGSRVVMTCRNRTCLWHGCMQVMTVAEATKFSAEGGSYQTLRHKVARIANSRGAAKFSHAKANEVRVRVFEREENREAIAAEMGVSRSLIDQVCRGARWAPQQIPGASAFTYRP